MGDCETERQSDSTYVLEWLLKSSNIHQHSKLKRGTCAGQGLSVGATSEQLAN